jgi:hypothetical protein
MKKLNLACIARSYKIINNKYKYINNYNNNVKIWEYLLI